MILHWEEWWRSMVCEGPLAWHFQTIHHPHRIIHHPIPVASFGLSDHVGEYPQIWSNFMVHHGSSPFSHIFPTKNRDIRIPFMAPFGIIHRFTGKKKRRSRWGSGDDALFHLFCGTQIPGYSPVERLLAWGADPIYSVVVEKWRSLWRYSMLVGGDWNHGILWLSIQLGME